MDTLDEQNTSPPSLSPPPLSSSSLPSSQENGKEGDEKITREGGGEKRETNIRICIPDIIIFSLIFMVILFWCYCIFLWIEFAFRGESKLLKTSLSSIITASIITILAIIIVFILRKLCK